MRVSVNNLIPGQNYGISFRFRSGETVGDWSPILRLTAPQDAVAPATPANFSTAINGTSFTAKWDAVTLSTDGTPASDLDHYEINVQSSGSASQKNYVTKGLNFDFPLEFNIAAFGTAQGNISMQVRAVDNVNNLGPWSALLSLTSPAPSQPANLVATPLQDSVNVKWDAVADLDLMEYQVFAGTTVGFVPSTTNRVFKGKTTSFVHNSISYGVDTFYKVAAVDVFSTLSTYAVSAAARPVSPFVVSTVAPPVPTGLTSVLTTAADTTTSAAVSWTAVVASRLSSYIVGYRSVGATDWSYATFDYTLTTTKIDRLTPYVNYEFRIRSSDWSANLSAWSATLTTTTSAVNIAPSAPVGVAFSGGLQTATVTWTENTELDVANGAGMYEVQIDTANTFSTANLKTIKTASTITSFVNLISNTTYYTRLRAIDSLGLAGAYSAIVSGAVGIVAGASSDGLAPSSSPTPSVSGGIGYLFVNWTAITNADPVIYEVHISTATGFTTGAGTKVGELAGTIISLEKDAAGAALAYGTTYYVKIIAKDKDGVAAAGTQASGSIARVLTSDLTVGAVDSTILAPAVTTSITNAQTTANTGVTNASTAQTQANTATTNAATAQTQANTATTNASTALTTAQGKNVTFIQGTTPTALAAGDLWIDTSNSNQLKRWSGSAWVDTRDTTIATAQTQANTATTNAATAQTQANTATTNAATAQTQANTATTNASTALSTAQGKNITFIQGTTPTALATGDLWIDTSNSNQLKRWSGTAWVDSRDTTIATAQTQANTGVTNAATAQTQANTATTNAATAQTQANLGVTNASNAQTTANTKTKTFIQSAVPTATTTGDIWIDTGNANILKTWNGTSWVTNQDGAIATAQTQANLGVTNAATADGKAVTATTNAATAQTQANLGVTNAATAQTQANTGVTNAATAQSLAATKTVTFTGTTAPTALTIGDLWIDTANGNIIKRATATGSGSWVALQDVAIATAQTQANTGVTNAATAQTQANLGVTNAGTAQTQANTATTNAATAQTQANAGVTNAATAQTLAASKTVTFTGSAVPSALAVGDIWVDSGNGNIIKRASATGTGSWVALQDTAISTAQTQATLGVNNAATAQGVANTASTNANTANTNASTALSTANAAQTAANGKNKVNYSASAPGTAANTIGDIWFQQDGSNVIIGQWTGASGTAWTVNTIGNAVVANLDAGKLTAGSIAAGRISAGLITSTMIATNTIVAGNIAAGAIVTASMTANTISGDRISVGTLDAGRITANTITASQIATDTITATQIAANAITVSELAAGAVTTAAMTANTISGDRISAGTLDASKITANTITAGQIFAGTITAAQMLAGTITAASGIIGTAAINTANIIDASIITAKIADLNVTTGKIALLAVDTAQINTAAITNAKIGTLAVDTGKIADLAVTDAKIATLSVTKLTAGTGIVNNLTVNSVLTLGDVSNTGVIQSYGYSAGTTGFTLSKSLLEINQGSIAAAALKIQQGENIIPVAYAGFEFAPTFYNTMPGGFTKTISNAGSAKFGTQCLQLRSPTAAANEVYFGTSVTDYNVNVVPGKTYILSAWVAGGPVTSNFYFQTKYSDATSSATIGLTSIVASSAYQRVYTTLLIPAGITSMVIRGYCDTATINAGWNIDGLQVEEQWSALSTPSAWTPPSATSIDGGYIRTGELRSTAIVSVNGVSQPSWLITMAGAAQFGDAQIRGKLLIGVSGADVDAGQSYMASGNYVAGTTGWKIDSSGNAEFSSGTFRGNLSGNTMTGATIVGSSIRTATTGLRWEMTGNLSDRLDGYTGQADETRAGMISIGYSSTTLGTVITSPAGPDGTNAGLELDAIRTGTPGSMGTLARITATDIEMVGPVTTSGYCTINNSLSVSGTVAINGAIVRRTNRGVNNGNTDTAGYINVPHGLGAAPVAFFANLTVGNTAAQNQLAKVLTMNSDASNMVFLVVRSDTGAALPSQAIHFYWFATL